MTKKILVVDDSKITRRMQKRMIQMLDLSTEVVEAGDGAEALEVLKGQAVDLVLCDLNMPNLDGEGFVRALRGGGETKLPVVVVTSDHSVARSERLIQLGATAYLTKPTSPEKLRAVIYPLLQAA